MTDGRMDSVNGHPLVSGHHSTRPDSVKKDSPGAMSCDPHVTNNYECDLRNAKSHGSTTWTKDSSSLACSGSEDNFTDLHDTLTETLTFPDSHDVENSPGLAGQPRAERIYHKEFVLIDDDEDGDMSLREKTVTDLSATDGKAAELVCGRPLSTSSGSLSEYEDESLARGGPPAQEKGVVHAEKPCCFCVLL